MALFEALEMIDLNRSTKMYNDPYFQERKTHIAQTLEAIENREMKLYENEAFDKEMDLFEQTLISKYDLVDENL